MPVYTEARGFSHAPCVPHIYVGEKLGHEPGVPFCRCFFQQPADFIGSLQPP